MAQAKKIVVSKEHPAITVSDNGGGNTEYEEILDLSPQTDVEYELRQEHPGLHLLLELLDSTSTEITDDAELRWTGQGPLEEDEKVLTRTYRYGEFANANQRNSDEEIHFEFVLDTEELPATFTEGSHLKLKMKHDTDVGWSTGPSKIEFEVYRRSFRR